MDRQGIKDLFKQIGFSDDTKGTAKNTFSCGISAQMANNRNSKGWVRAEYILLEDDITNQAELQEKWLDQGHVRDGVAPYAPQYLIFQSNGEWIVWDSYGNKIGSDDDLKKIVGYNYFLQV